jgi:adenine-specific DNA-methyltransferase
MPIEKLKALMPSSYKGFNYEAESDEGGDFVVKNELYNTNSAFNEETRPNLVFNIHYNFKTKEVKFTDANVAETFPGFTKISPKKNNDGRHKYHAWRWSKDKIVNELSDLKFVETEDGAKIYTKIRSYLSTALKDIITDIYKLESHIGASNNRSSHYQ